MQGFLYALILIIGIQKEVLYMKKLLCIMLGVLCVLSLFGCSKENENDALMRIPADVSNIEDFKCVCSTDNETEFLIEGESAKELYTYISEKQQQAEQTEIDRTEHKITFICLSKTANRFIL